MSTASTLRAAPSHRRLYGGLDCRQRGAQINATPEQLFAMIAPRSNRAASPRQGSAATSPAMRHHTMTRAVRHCGRCRHDDETRRPQRHHRRPSSTGVSATTTALHGRGAQNQALTLLLRASGFAPADTVSVVTANRPGRGGASSTTAAPSTSARPNWPRQHRHGPPRLFVDRLGNRARTSSPPPTRLDRLCRKTSPSAPTTPRNTGMFSRASA